MRIGTGQGEHRGRRSADRASAALAGGDGKSAAAQMADPLA